MFYLYEILKEFYLRFIERINQLLIVQDVALRFKEQLKDAILDGLELVLISVDADNQLVPLLLQVRTLQSHNITVSKKGSSYVIHKYTQQLINSNWSRWHHVACDIYMHSKEYLNIGMACNLTWR